MQTQWLPCKTDSFECRSCSRRTDVNIPAVLLCCHSFNARFCWAEVTETVAVTLSCEWFTVWSDHEGFSNACRWLTAFCQKRQCWALSMESVWRRRRFYPSGKPSLETSSMELRSSLTPTSVAVNVSHASTHKTLLVGFFYHGCPLFVTLWSLSV